MLPRIRDESSFHKNPRGYRDVGCGVGVPDEQYWQHHQTENAEGKEREKYPVHVRGKLRKTHTAPCYFSRAFLCNGKQIFYTLRVITVIDYGMGNLKSVCNAVEALGQEVCLTRDPERIQTASGIILPGVGAFGEGMRNLHAFGLVDVLNREVIGKKKPYLGICLGLQFLARTGFEDGEHAGLGWVEGVVKLIEPQGDDHKVPHMGWNNVEVLRDSVILRNLRKDPVFYFVHSYALVLDSTEKGILTSVADHGCTITASLEKDNIFATQFHPEKSQSTGLMVLKNFISFCESHAQT